MPLFALLSDLYWTYFANATILLAVYYTVVCAFAAPIPSNIPKPKPTKKAPKPVPTNCSDPPTAFISRKECPDLIPDNWPRDRPIPADTTLRRLEFTEMWLQESVRQNTAYRKAVDEYEESIAAIQAERSKEYKEKSSDSWMLSWQSRNAQDSMLEQQMKDAEKIKVMEAELAARPTNAYFLSVQQEAQAALEAAKEENRRAKDDLSRMKANPQYHLEQTYQTIKNERDAMVVERDMAYARAKGAVDCILQIKTLVHKGNAERNELMRGFSQRPRRLTPATENKDAYTDIPTFEVDCKNKGSEISSFIPIQYYHLCHMSEVYWKPRDEL